MSGVCDACKKHTGERFKISPLVMDHCFLHRKAGGKPHLKKFKPAGFGHFSPVKSVREIYSKELAKSLTFNSKPKRFISESIACTFLPQKHENTNFE